MAYIIYMSLNLKKKIFLLQWIIVLYRLNKSTTWHIVFHFQCTWMYLSGVQHNQHSITACDSRFQLHLQFTTRCHPYTLKNSQAQSHNVQGGLRHNFRSYRKYLWRLRSQVIGDKTNLLHNITLHLCWCLYMCFPPQLCKCFPPYVYLGTTVAKLATLFNQV